MPRLVVTNSNTSQHYQQVQVAGSTPAVGFQHARVRSGVACMFARQRLLLRHAAALWGCGMALRESPSFRKSGGDAVSARVHMKSRTALPALPCFFCERHTWAASFFLSCMLGSANRHPARSAAWTGSSSRLKGTHTCGCAAAPHETGRAAREQRAARATHLCSRQTSPHWHQRRAVLPSGASANQHFFSPFSPVAVYPAGLFLVRLPNVRVRVRAHPGAASSVARRSHYRARRAAHRRPAQRRARHTAAPLGPASVCKPVPSSRPTHLAPERASRAREAWASSLGHLAGGHDDAPGGARGDRVVGRAHVEAAICKRPRDRRAREVVISSCAGRPCLAQAPIVLPGLAAHPWMQAHRIGVVVAGGSSGRSAPHAAVAPCAHPAPAKPLASGTSAAGSGASSGAGCGMPTPQQQPAHCHGRRGGASASAAPWVCRAVATASTTAERGVVNTRASTYSFHSKAGAVVGLPPPCSAPASCAATTALCAPSTTCTVAKLTGCGLPCTARGEEGGHAHAHGRGTASPNCNIHHHLVLAPPRSPQTMHARTPAAGALLHRPLPHFHPPTHPTLPTQTQTHDWYCACRHALRPTRWARASSLWPRRYGCRSRAGQHHMPFHAMAFITSCKCMYACPKRQSVPRGRAGVGVGPGQRRQQQQAGGGHHGVVRQRARHRAVAAHAALVSHPAGKGVGAGGRAIGNACGGRGAAALLCIRARQ